MARDAVRGTVNPSFLLIDPRSRKTSHIYQNIHPHLVYFPGVLAGLPFGKLTGERDGFVSAVGLFVKQIIINLFWDIAWVTVGKGQEAFVSLCPLVAPLLHNIIGNLSTKLIFFRFTWNVKMDAVKSYYYRQVHSGSRLESMVLVSLQKKCVHCIFSYI